MKTKIKNTFLLVTTLLFLFASPGTVRADLTLAFDPTGVPVSFTVNVGETVDIQVYLIQSGQPIANGDLMIDGVISMGIQLNFDASPGSSIVSGTTHAPAFNDFLETVIQNSQGNAALTGAVGFTDPPVTGTSVLLGTITFEGVTGGNVTMVSVTSPDILSTPGPYYVSGSSPPIALDSNIFPVSAMTMISTNTFILGDVNRDGVVNLLDVSPFIALLSSGVYQVEADTNQDGVINLLDVSPFIALLSGG